MALRDDIPRYDVLDLLGEGALATVYRVRSRKDGSIRALKALKPEQATTPRALERFADEYRILSALHHPCLPEVYDFGHAAAGSPFIVMEFLEGAPFDDYLRDNPADLWILLFQMNEALSFIHEHGLLHLDLKPSNVLVRKTKIFGDEESPLAALIDFGLSYRRDVGGKVKLVGTPGYMAPEIVRGEENLTRAVDYYSLGVVIYEIIEGQLPFRGSLHDILRGHLADEIVFERRKVEHAELQPWVEKLMSKEPRERLDAFQGFRRAVAARLGQSVEKLERVFALGYIDSLGLVGKEEVWEELRSWVSGVSSGLAERAARSARPADDVADAARKGAPAASDVLKGSVSDLEERIRQDLLSQAAIHAPARVADLIESVPRVLAVTGPPESGKSHLLDALKIELRARGLGVVSLGRESDYQLLVGESAPESVDPSQIADPSALVTDRFNSGWKELARLGAESGVVVIVDDLSGASAEEKEFVEYVGKRASHDAAERKEPGVFVVAVGPHADVKKALQPVLLRDADLAALEVPPPGKGDAESIAGGFRGRLSGVKEERSLASFLESNLQTSAALHRALKHSVNEGFLVLRHGKWEFHEGSVKPLAGAAKADGYYEAIVRDLAGPAREVVAHLACHPTGLSIEQISKVSGLSPAEIDQAADTLRPHRIVEAAETAAGRVLDLISDQVRHSLLRALTKKNRGRIHKRFAEYFGGRPEDTVRYWEMMSHHREQLGLAREALTARIRAVALARRAMDVFALRRLCEGGVDYARRLKGAEWSGRKWLIERFFLKEWIHGESQMANYRNVVGVVEDHLVRRKREVPVSLLYEYAVGLERVGRREDCERVLKEGEDRLSEEDSETGGLLSLQWARMLYNAGQFHESLARLQKVHAARIPDWARARQLSTYTLNYSHLGLEDGWIQAVTEAEQLPRESRFIDHLLRIEYSKIRKLLVRGTYSPAKQLIRSGIRLAARHRAYRSLCSMYFIASALYYETGDYIRAARFLDKTIRVAKEHAIPEMIFDFTLRHAFISKKLGLFGNAIEIARSLVRATKREGATQSQFSSLVALLDMLTTVDVGQADGIVLTLCRMADAIEDHNRLATYRRTLGYYYMKIGDFDRAIREFEVARELFSAAMMNDDLAETDSAMAAVMIRQNRTDEAEKLLSKVKSAVDAMESAELRARYATAELARLLKSGADHDTIRRCLNLYEVIVPEVAEVKVALDLDGLLFRSAVLVGDNSRALGIFDRYYARLRQIVGNLPEKYANKYVRDSELTEIIELYRSSKTRDPGRC